MPSSPAIDQIRTLIAKGLTVQQVAVVISVVLGANVTAKQVKEWIDTASKTKKSS
jgi:hypothetical protein